MAVNTLIISAAKASVEDVGRDLNRWCEILRDEGAEVNHTEHKTDKGVYHHQIDISLDHVAMTFRVKSQHPFCCFEPTKLSVGSSSYLARSLGRGNFDITDINGHHVSESSEIYNLVRVIHGRILREL